MEDTYMDGIYENIEEYNSNKRRKILVAFNYIIADILSNKQIDQVIIELFIRGRKLNISLVLLHNIILLYQTILD